MTCRTLIPVGSDNTKTSHASSSSATASIWRPSELIPSSLDTRILIINLVVGVTGFEPMTTGPPDQCATRLRYTPTGLID